MLFFNPLEAHSRIVVVNAESQLKKLARSKRQEELDDMNDSSR